MKIPIYNQAAEKIGEVELNAKIYEVKPSLHLMAEAVRTQAANARKGLAHTKTRGDVSGGGKKPWKQKGTGRARAGSTRGPIWRHGGVALGPRSERNWSLKINKKAKTKALFMALSDKARDGKIVILDMVTLATPKTKEFVKIIAQLNSKLQTAKTNKQMFLLPKNDATLVRVSRNVPSITPTMATSLNITDVMRAENIIMMRDSLAIIEKTYLKDLTKATK